MGKTTTITGTLEIDHDRGVIYFHASDKEFIEKYKVFTVLRVCNLPFPIPEINNRMLDITHMYGADWGGDLRNVYRKRD